MAPAAAEGEPMVFSPSPELPAATTTTTFWATAASTARLKASWPSELPGMARLRLITWSLFATHHSSPVMMPLSGPEPA